MHTDGTDPTRLVCGRGSASLDGGSAARNQVLLGDRKGQHSIRINDQYRICFEWTERGATEVEIVDYH